MTSETVRGLMLALALPLVTCVEARPGPSSAFLACPTPLPRAVPGMDDAITVAPASEESIQDFDFWRDTYRHGSNAQLALLISAGEPGSPYVFDRSW